MIRKFISWIDRRIYQIAIRKKPNFLYSGDDEEFWTENHEENPLIQRFLENPFDKLYFPKAYFLFFILPVFFVFGEWNSTFQEYLSFLFLVI